MERPRRRLCEERCLSSIKYRLSWGNSIHANLVIGLDLYVHDSIFLSYVIDLGTHTIDGPASWRIPVGLQMLWGLIILSGIFFLPESPYVLPSIVLLPFPESPIIGYSRHLLGTGRVDEARAVIAQLNGLPEDDPIVVDEIEELEYGIHQENDGGKPTWVECFSTRNMLWKRTINGMMLQFIQQLNGQNFYCELQFVYSTFYPNLLIFVQPRLLWRYVLQECRHHVCSNQIY